MRFDCENGGRHVRNIKIILEYDGTGLSGWQRQANQPTIQRHVEDALSTVLNHAVTVNGSGRTDAGVHARGQVANFLTSSPRKEHQILKGCNTLLPEQISILSVEEVPGDFHARYSVKSKVYDYDLDVSPVRPAIRRNFVWSQTLPLDIEAMAETMQVLLGEHDFAAFQSTGTDVKTTVRRMMRAYLSKPEENLIRISMEADGFLRHMVRAIVGTLVLVGGGRLSKREFKEILEGCDRAKAGPTAPPQGLYLREVKY